MKPANGTAFQRQSPSQLGLCGLCHPFLHHSITLPLFREFQLQFTHPVPISDLLVHELENYLIYRHNGNSKNSDTQKWRKWKLGFVCSLLSWQMPCLSIVEFFASQLSDSAHHSVCDSQSLSKRGILIINRSAWHATYFYIYVQGR